MKTRRQAFVEELQKQLTAKQTEPSKTYRGEMQEDMSSEDTIKALEKKLDELFGVPDDSDD